MACPTSDARSLLRSRRPPLSCSSPAAGGDDDGGDLDAFCDQAQEFVTVLQGVDGAQQLAAAAQEFQAVFTGPSGTGVDEFGTENCD